MPRMQLIASYERRSPSVDTKMVLARMMQNNCFIGIGDLARLLKAAHKAREMLFGVWAEIVLRKGHFQRWIKKALGALV